MNHAIKGPFVISEKRRQQLTAYCGKFHLPMDDLEILNLSLVHSSLTTRHEAGEDNQRLEFLGDSVLSLCISRYLFSRFPDADEGRLTRIRSYLVSEKRLARLARHIELDSVLVMSWGEENTGGRTRDANLADSFEALLAAVFITKGLDAVCGFLIPLVENFFDMEEVTRENFIFDYKTEFQYLIQKKYKTTPVYEIIKEEGPPHNRIFYSRLILEDRLLSEGQGSSKKRAEQQAAREALRMLETGELKI